MTAIANGTFKIAGWDEKPYAELENGGKLTQASVKQSSLETSKAKARSNG